MSAGELLARGGAVVVVLLGRAPQPFRTPLIGLFAGVAVLGLSPRSLPDSRAGFLTGAALGVLLCASFWRIWSPLASRAGVSTVLLALPLALVSAGLLAAGTRGGALLGVAAAGAAVSAFGAVGCLANTEAGWRRGLLWAAAAFAPACVGAAAAYAGERLAYREYFSAAAGLLGAALLFWTPTLVLEWLRTRRELGEEARLALLPEEDVRVLSVPWRRLLEPRFGRRDERREYVVSALLLAVVRQQQRRRSGEPARLRQLEVITFRTRIRRTLTARQARWSGVEPVHEPLPDESAGPARRAIESD